MKALQYIMNYGVTLITAYPYNAVTGVCSNTTKTKYKTTNKVYWAKTNLDMAAAQVGAGKHVVISVYASGGFRYLSNSTDTYDASLSGECMTPRNHAVNLVKSNGNYAFTLLNSWSTQWASLGMKNIKACNSTTFWGDNGYLTYLGV